MKKYGIENFAFQVLATASGTNFLAYLNLLEPFCIVLYGSIAPNGYNLESGGKNKGKMHESTIAKLRLINQGRRPTLSEWTPERRALLGQSKKGNQYCKGRKHTPEACAKISAAHKGKTISPEHKARLRETSKGNQNRKGAVIPLEMRARISAKLKGRDVRKEKREKDQCNNSIKG